MTWVVLAISFVGGATGAGDGPSVQRRFDDARESFLTGYYRHAFEEFSDLAGAGDEELAASAGIAMADCQMAWGDYEGALETLQSIRDFTWPEGHGSGSERGIARAEARGSLDSLLERRVAGECGGHLLEGARCCRGGDSCSVAFVVAA
ncbi:MAG: hypothetical protein IIA33_07815 [Planctomycetes bacterium]|nr:hypothetical protein [Planctomycetota bacterium]